MTRTLAHTFVVPAVLVAGCAASPAAPPASEYVWSTPRAGDTREAHVYGEPATLTPQRAAVQPVPDAPPGTWAEPQQGAPVATSGTPWVESSDPRWTTHRIAASESAYDDSAPAAVTYAPAPVYVNSYPGPWGYGPGYYGPYYSRPFIGVGIGFGGFRGGGFHGGFGGGFHGGFRGGGHGWGRR